MAATPEEIAKLDTAGRVRAAREALGYTREQLAAIAGVSYGGLEKIETGVSLPNGENFMRLAAALGTTVEDLLPANYTELFAPLVKPSDRLASLPASVSVVGLAAGARSSARSSSVRSSNTNRARAAAEKKARAAQRKRATKKTGREGGI